MDSSDEMDDVTMGDAERRGAPSTAKERTAVQRAVDRLLDELAPERAVSRAGRLTLPVPVERHRTRRGCILQAPAAAVSVSWFPDAGEDVAAGELHVAAWQGVLSHPGSARRTAGASVVRELVLRPVESGPDAWVWRGDDGTRYDTDGAAALCLALLEEQVTGSAPVG